MIKSLKTISFAETAILSTLHSLSNSDIVERITGSGSKLDTHTHRRRCALSQALSYTIKSMFEHPSQSDALSPSFRSNTLQLVDCYRTFKIQEI